MTVICEKCGKEFALLEETDAKKAFCPYCGAQTNAEEAGEICLTETDVSVRGDASATVAEAPNNVKPWEEYAWLKWGLIGLVSAVAISGLISLFVWIFKQNDAWTVWQWIIGLVVCFTLVCFVFGCLAECDDKIALFTVNSVALINIVLAMIFLEKYFILFGCVSVGTAICNIILAISSFRDDEKGIGVFSLIAAGVIVIFMIFGLALDFSWAFWQWIIGIGGGVGISIALCSYGLDDLDDNQISAVTLNGVAAAVNIVLNLILDEGYTIIFGCISVSTSICGIILAISSFRNYENGAGIAGLIEAGVIIVFMISGLALDFSWTFWQWVIGLGGGALLMVGIGYLEWEVMEGDSPFSIIAMFVLTGANMYLFQGFDENYVIIYNCLSWVLAIGNLIFAIMHFKEEETGKGVWHLVGIAAVIFVFVSMSGYVE